MNLSVYTPPAVDDLAEERIEAYRLVLNARLREMGNGARQSFWTITSRICPTVVRSPTALESAATDVAAGLLRSLEANWLGKTQSERKQWLLDEILGHVDEEGIRLCL